MHPNYNCYIYDQGRVSAVTVRLPGEWSDIVVNKHNRCFGLLDKAHYLGVGIKYLAIKEDAFNRWQRGAHEEVYLAFQFLYLDVLLGSMLFKSCDTSVNYISTQ